MIIGVWPFKIVPQGFFWVVNLGEKKKITKYTSCKPKYGTFPFNIWVQFYCHRRMKSGTWPCSLLYRVALFKDLAELWACCCNLMPPLQEVCSVKVWVGYTGYNTPVQDRVYSYLSSFIFMVVTLYAHIVYLWILTFSSWTDAGGHAFEYLKSELHSRFRQESQDFLAEKFCSLEQECRFVIKKSIMSKNISGF